MPKTDQEILHSPFDMETHKKHFIHYLEVVILEDGTIEYAVPSHIKKIENICCEKLGLKFDNDYLDCKELWEYFLKDHKVYDDYHGWLFSISKAICVWENFWDGIINEKQLTKLKELKDYGLYLGEI